MPLVRHTFRAISFRSLALCIGVLVCAISYSLHIIDRGKLRVREPAGFAQQKQTPDVVTVFESPSIKVVSVTEYGHIVEVEGSTDSDASVMINGQPAVTVFPGHSFRHFIGPLATGTTIITITSQNARGGVSTKQIAVDIP